MAKAFTEKEIRKSLLNKIDFIIVKNPGHWKGKIFLNDVLISKIKIPNPHNKHFGKGKIKVLRKSLCLSLSQFNDLINCPLKKHEYYQILENFK